MKLHNILVILALILGVFLFSKAIHSPPYDRSDILFFIYFISPYLIVLLRNIFIFKNANYTSLTLSALILVLITGSLYSPSTINSSSTAPLVFLGAPLIILILETIFCLIFLLFESPTFLHPTSVKPIQKNSIALIAFFLGGIGIHDFMLGNKKRGIGKIILFLSSSLIITLLFLWIWIVLDLFQIADGTYPAEKGLLIGDGQTAHKLSKIYLVLGIIFLLSAFASFVFNIA